MGKLNIYTISIVTFLIVIIASAGYLFYRSKQSSTLLSYSNQTYGLTFMYPKKYKLSELHGEGSRIATLSFHEKSLLLFLSDTSPDPITISVYESATETNPLTSAQQWIDESPDSMFSHTLMEKPGATRVANQEALLYTWKDVMEGTTVVTSYRGRILVFTVTYTGNADMQTRDDFTDIIESVIFGEVRGVPTN